jgi:hypothetical protein
VLVDSSLSDQGKQHKMGDCNAIVLFVIGERCEINQYFFDILKDNKVDGSCDGEEEGKRRLLIGDITGKEVDATVASVSNAEEIGPN